MKKRLVLFLAAILPAQMILAQEDNSGSQIDVQKLRFGAFIAPNISWMRPTATKSDDGMFAVQNNGSKFGYNWGLMADYYFAQNYGLVTGFQINNTGGKILAENVSTALPVNKVMKADFSYMIQYLEVPLALKLRTDEISGLKFFGQLGLTAGINISKKITYQVDYYDGSGVSQTVTGNKEKLSGSLTIAPVMLQMNVGGGLEAPITQKLMFYTGLFFNNGFLPDATNPDQFSLGYTGSFRDGNTRLNNFSLRVGLFF